MSGFLGNYVHQIDGKGRLSLPAAFRREAPEGPLVLVQVHEGALTLYPEAAWALVEERLSDLLRRQPQSRAYVLGVTANAVETVPDKQGRILIPQRLLNAIGLKDAAVVAGMIDRIEVWEPQRFDETVEAGAADGSIYAGQIFA
ncbi:MAG TPA: division/cell wall cluster transcriptional repressor MraZ [Longimicrobiaceae bacterium]|nr:division/cell wall cluster transcriptional repressor MraZ [Longimicrobiaceae bacterium]